MDIQNPAFVVFNKPRTQNAHEAGKYQQVHAILVQRSCESPLEGLSVRIGCMFDTYAGDIGIRSSLQTECVGTVTNNDSDIKIESAVGNLINE